MLASHRLSPTRLNALRRSSEHISFENSLPDTPPIRSQVHSWLHVRGPQVKCIPYAGFQSLSRPHGCRSHPRSFLSQKYQNVSLVVMICKLLSLRDVAISFDKARALRMSRLPRIWVALSSIVVSCFSARNCRCLVSSFGESGTISPGTICSQRTAYMSKAIKV